MYIKKIKLKNFRNYENLEINLENKINIFYGDNAQGKTNILEAIYLCALGKSFRTKKEKELILFSKENSFIEIIYQKKDREGKINLEINNKKYFYLNNIKLKKLSEILGNINIVLFSPDDINIIKGVPENRRKFLNIMISQLRPNYVYNYNLYLKILEQRNNYLRQIKFENKNKELLEIWNQQLTICAENVYNYRKEFIEKILNKINNIHSKITEEKEKINIKYISNFKSKEEFLKELKESEDIDIQKGYTTKGIHRDDFEIYINNNKLNIYGSQGQIRSFILSLKLSELEIIYDEIGEYPILLLDDFMSELDEKRRIGFMNSVKDAQVLITCTDKLVDNMWITFNVKDGHVDKLIKNFSN